MAEDASQEGVHNGIEWHKSSSQLHKDALSTFRVTETDVLNETIEAVKEKVWSFKSAWRGIAEVLCKVGASPSILGYSSVPANEEGYVKEQDEGVLALQKVDEGVDSRESCLGFLNRELSSGSAPDEESLLHIEEEEEEVNHGFAESARKETVERKSLKISSS